MKKTNRRNIQKKELLAFQIIKKASEGDVEAIQKVLEHYNGYIQKLSSRIVYDEYGDIHYWVDDEVRKRLEIRLITTILRFHI